MVALSETSRLISRRFRLALPHERERPRVPDELLSCLHGVRVEPLLVHYIMFKGQPTHNAPIVTNKEMLTKHLQEMKAVLVQA